MGRLLTKNRNGLIVDGCVTQAGGQAERIAALADGRGADAQKALTRPILAVHHRGTNFET